MTSLAESAYICGTIAAVIVVVAVAAFGLRNALTFLHAQTKNGQCPKVTDIYLLNGCTMSTTKIDVFFSSRLATRWEFSYIYIFCRPKIMNEWKE